jgi:glycosyltransferase involved in cell wall biosynthesis
MRVLIIAQYFPPDMGGGATRAYNVAKGLELNGCKVMVVTAFPHYPNGNIPEKYRWKPLALEDIKGLRVARTFVPPLASRGLTRRLLLYLSFIFSVFFALPFAGKVDVVWAANPNVLSVFPALFCGFIRRKPVGLNVDDLWPDDLSNFGLVDESSLAFKAMYFVARFAYVKASLITPISPAWGEVLCEKYGVNRKRVHVIRGGVDFDTFGVASEEINHREGAFSVLYSGAFSVAYDFDQILLAARVLENESDVEFTLQGGGELAGYVKSRVEELKLGNVKVIDKIISRAEVAKMLSQADALILPLRGSGKPYLGISSKLYEYQAAAKPIICCAQGKPAEYTKETGSGIVVRPGDSEALAKAVVFLENNRAIAEKMGASGRYHARKNFSIEKIGLKMMKAFAHALENQV